MFILGAILWLVVVVVVARVFRGTSGASDDYTRAVCKENVCGLDQSAGVNETVCFGCVFPVGAERG
jgi:hypothetical protein